MCAGRGEGGAGGVAPGDRINSSRVMFLPRFMYEWKVRKGGEAVAVGVSSSSCLKRKKINAVALENVDFGLGTLAHVFHYRLQPSLSELL